MTDFITRSILRVESDGHWTTEELHQLREIQTFEAMVPIAKNILNRMQKTTDSPIYQLCGPMTTGGKGNVELNMSHFHRAIDVAREKGLLVFDQTPFQEAMSRLVKANQNSKEYCLDILHVFYRGIFKSGLVSTLLFLPDWESSKGATWEWEEAGTLGIKRELYPIEWLPLLEKIE